MPKEPIKTSNINSLKAQNSSAEVEDEGCKCCHCGSAAEDLRSQTYLKMREHLQQRLKTKNNPPNSTCASITGSRSSSCNIDSEEVDYLVSFIEGNRNIVESNAPNPKKAAKKARQKEKKMLEQKRAEELATKKVAAADKKLPAAQNKEGEEKVPNGMVRITHNPLTNSAVITPLYGPIQPTPSYLQQPLSFSQPFKMTPSPSPGVSDPIIPSPSYPTKPIPNPTYTSPSSKTTSASQSLPNGQPMVTIRRVMQPNISEPVVTVTLKGETPDNDRVLFTLVNGHVLSSDKPKNGQEPSNTQPSPASAIHNAPAISNAQTRKKQKKLEKRRQKKLLEAANQNSTTVQPILSPEVKLPDPSVGRYNPPQDFSLENFRLPPGITLTRIQGSHPPPHPELPVRLVDQQPGREMSMHSSSSSMGGQNPIIVTSPLSPPKTKESMAAPNVIVVDTRKMQQEPITQQQTVRVIQTCSVACQTGEDFDEDELNPATLTKKQRKKLRRKEKMLEEQAVLNQLAQLQLETDSKKISANKNIAAINHNAKTKALQSNNSKTLTKQSDSQKGNTTKESKGNKKKKKKSRTHAGQQGTEDKWEENVFVPKADIDLDGGDLDEDERELEAFKRFCFNSVPPERKEKVRINLNVKDIFGRKSNGLQAASCK